MGRKGQNDTLILLIGCHELSFVSHAGVKLTNVSKISTIFFHVNLRNVKRGGWPASSLLHLSSSQLYISPYQRTPDRLSGNKADVWWSRLPTHTALLIRTRTIEHAQSALSLAGSSVDDSTAARHSGIPNSMRGAPTQNIKRCTSETNDLRST